MCVNIICDYYLCLWVYLSSVISIHPLPFSMFMEYYIFFCWILTSYIGYSCSLTFMRISNNMFSCIPILYHISYSNIFSIVSLSFMYLFLFCSHLVMENLWVLLSKIDPTPMSYKSSNNWTISCVFISVSAFLPDYILVFMDSRNPTRTHSLAKSDIQSLSPMASDAWTVTLLFLSIFAYRIVSPNISIVLFIHYSTSSLKY